MKKIESVYADWQRHQADLEARAQRWRERRRRFNRRAIIMSAIVYALSFRLQAFDGNFNCWLWIPTLAVGALAAWPIVHWRLGILWAGPVYGAIAMGWEMTVLVFHLFSPAESSQIVLNAGPILIMICIWVWWVVYGMIIGLLASQEEDDTVQI